jgi:hypothetical protein
LGGFFAAADEEEKRGGEREDFKDTYKSISGLLSYMPMSASAMGKVGTFPAKMRKFLRTVIRRGRNPSLFGWRR